MKWIVGGVSQAVTEVHTEPSEAPKGAHTMPYLTES